MIKTVGFRQLVSSPLSRFMSEFETTDRVQIPTRARSLVRYGLNLESAEQIENMAIDVTEEARLVATFILIAYKDKGLAAREELIRWIERKGGVSDRKQEKLLKLFIEFARHDVWNSQDFSTGETSDVLSKKSWTHQINLAGHRIKGTSNIIPIMNGSHNTQQNFLCFSCA